MKTIYATLIGIAFFAMTPVANAQDFYLHPNGVTCMCPNAAIGDTGEINGVTYTKRTEEQITPQNAATTCTSGIMDMSKLFNGASSFNENISSWDTSEVTDMNEMFRDASSFNQPIDNWDVSNVTIMDRMFRNANSFNQTLNNWDVSNVINMDQMFRDATSFNQDISGWCVEQIPTEPTNFSSNSPLQESFKPKWGVECNLSNANVSIHQIDIKLYPNPTSDEFILNNQSDYNIEKITILNMKGQVVKQVNGNQDKTQRIDVKELASGNYFIQISTTDHKYLTKHLIKN